MMEADLLGGMHVAIRAEGRGHSIMSTVSYLRSRVCVFPDPKF